MILESIIIGLLLSFLFKKDIKKLNEFKINGKIFLVIGILINIFLNIFTKYDFKEVTYFTINNYEVFHITYLLFLIVGLFFNYKNKSVLIIGFGILLNTIVVILNGKMPVDLDKLLLTKNERLINIITSGRSLSHGVFENEKLKIFSDIILLPYPWAKIISLGDILVSIGIILFIIRAGE